MSLTPLILFYYYYNRNTVAFLHVDQSGPAVGWTRIWRSDLEAEYRPGAGDHGRCHVEAAKLSTLYTLTEWIKQ